MQLVGEWQMSEAIEETHRLEKEIDTREKETQVIESHTKHRDR